MRGRRGSLEGELTGRRVLKRNILVNKELIVHFFLFLKFYKTLCLPPCQARDAFIQGYQPVEKDLEFLLLLQGKAVNNTSKYVPHVLDWLLNGRVEYPVVLQSYQ